MCLCLILRPDTSGKVARRGQEARPGRNLGGSGRSSDACKIPEIFGLPAVVLIFNFTSKFENFPFFDASISIRPLLMLNRGI